MVRRTITFVSGQLPRWRDDTSRPRRDAEPELNEQLCKFLDDRARDEFSLVRFNHEEHQKGMHRADLSATPSNALVGVGYSSIYEPFIVFECKRLPAPSRAREREYVTGDDGDGERGGGIQRFKLGLHGPELEICAVIGYLQTGSPTEWFARVNDWIEQLIGAICKDGSSWDASDKLEKLDVSWPVGTSVCKSAHGRTDSRTGRVELTHLWVEMRGR
ncbi:MAG: hypothetical protein IPK82_08195 [Polyangiaceae bacterium]|nr:hypothetical protein [Polyangiaceae bacterium]